jgi:hypothetical protein
VPGDLAHLPITPARDGSRKAFSCPRGPVPSDLFAGRIRPEDLVDLLVASLGSAGTAVTAGERGELRSLLAAMDMPDDPLAGLTVEGEPA